MRRGTTFDFWPAVADFFVGILAVIVFVFIGHKPIDPQIEAFREELKTQLDRDKVSGLVREYDLRPSSVRIVYSAQALSFQTCEWKLPEEKANLVRAHLRLLGERVDLVERIQVEGHADKRSIEGCGQIVPYRDNLQLSQNRARAVYNALLGLLPTSPGGLEAVLAGLPEAPPAPPGLQYVRALTAAGRVQVAGFGSTLPLDPDAPESEINRRVEIIVRFKD